MMIIPQIFEDTYVESPNYIETKKITNIKNYYTSGHEIGKGINK